MPALDGIRVIELTTMITGPLAGMLLADLGASVTKIENRDGGDPFRSFRGGRYSGHFISYNRNKRSLTLDLRAPQGKEICLKLVRQADVLIDNFRPGVLDRLGFGDAILRDANPRLIHASITGFGASGPYRDRPSYDAVAQSLSGVLSQFIDPEMPEVGGPTLSDNISGFYAAYGILGALYERERSGKGRRVDVNMLEAGIAFIPDPFSNFTRAGVRSGPLTRVAASQSFAFRCGDGKLLAVHLSSQAKFFESAAAALECPDLVRDERFLTRDLRIKNYGELTRIFGEIIGTKRRLHWMTVLEAHDVPFAPIHDLAEVLDDPQVRHLRTFYEQEHPTQGKITAIHRPVLIDGERAERALPAPTLAEHTDAILAELGFDPTQAAELKAKKVV